MEKMKANRKFKNKDDDAVSAVIGVILMVAITVAIAATVYVYVSGMIGTSPQSTPSMQLVKDDINDKLTVASADPGDLKWSSFSISYTGTSASIQFSNNTFKDIAESENLGDDYLVKAGEYINVSSDGVTISIRHTDTNTLIGSWEFN